MFGLVKSKLDGSEKIYSPKNISKIPPRYSYVNVLPKVLNQGSDPICCPCSISAYINWKINCRTGDKRDNGVDYFEIYNARSMKMCEGMSFKDGLGFVKRHGVRTKAGNFKVNDYALIKNPIALKMALLANGPCLIALPVYEPTVNSFWLPRKGQQDKDVLGYHAVAVVGYDEEGFIIRNSWGKSYCENGYSKLLYRDFNRIIEIWTIF